ncbi:MAG: sulfatase-like hydrolase/transferase, partial [Oscillospiraceae bacterium]
MKKNLLFFHLDSLMYDAIVDTKNRKCPMPFLQSLVSQGLHTDKLYSKAPYTEAAIMSLYCGFDTMSYGGYMEKFANAPNIIYKVLKKNGYRTFTIGQTYVFSSVEDLGFSDYYYAIGHDFHAFWPYRLSYFSPLYKQNKLDENDYECLFRMFESNMEEWLCFLHLVINKDDKVKFLLQFCSKIDMAQSTADELERQKLIYFSDKKSYINDFLNQGYDHILLRLPSFMLDKKVTNPEAIDFITTQFHDFAKESYKFNQKQNLKYNHISIPFCFKLLAKMIKSPTKANLKLFARYLLNYKESIFDSDMMSRFEKDYYNMKNGMSITSHYNLFLDWYDNVYDKNSPFAAFFTIDDIHNNEMFFSYDSNDVDVLKQELKQLQEFKKTLPKQYKGSISYDYAMVYLDNVLKKIYYSLKEKGILDNSYLVLTSDHGFSFRNDPVRCENVTNFYAENYHVPFVVLGDDIQSKKVSDFRTSCDVTATILDVLGIEKPDTYRGTSFNEPSTKDYVTMEYMGAGCPDVRRRPLQFAAR